MLCNDFLGGGWIGPAVFPLKVKLCKSPSLSVSSRGQEATNKENAERPLQTDKKLTNWVLFFVFFPHHPSVTDSCSPASGFSFQETKQTHRVMYRLMHPIQEEMTLNLFNESNKQSRNPASPPPPKKWN